MAQTMYKTDINTRGIVVRFCRKYRLYSESNDSFRAGVAKAVSENLFTIGCDIVSDELRTKLRYAIWHSTVNAREYPYEVWDLPTISRNDFYERKRKFIYDVAKEIGI